MIIIINRKLIYNTENIPSYRVRKALVELDGTLKMSVQLVSGGNRVTTIRTFDSDIDADSFMNTHTVYDMLLMNKDNK